MWKRQQWKHRHITISQNRTASSFTTRKNRQKSKWTKYLNRFRIVSFNSQWISNHKNKWYYNNIFFASICTNMRCINCSTNCTAVARIRQRRAVILLSSYKQDITLGAQYGILFTFHWAVIPPRLINFKDSHPCVSAAWRTLDLRYIIRRNALQNARSIQVGRWTNWKVTQANWMSTDFVLACVLIDISGGVARSLLTEEVVDERVVNSIANVACSCCCCTCFFRCIIEQRGQVSGFDAVHPRPLFGDRPRSARQFAILMVALWFLGPVAEWTRPLSRINVRMWRYRCVFGRVSASKVCLPHVKQVWVWFDTRTVKTESVGWIFWYYVKLFSDYFDYSFE